MECTRNAELISQLELRLDELLEERKVSYVDYCYYNLVATLLKGCR